MSRPRPPPPAGRGEDDGTVNPARGLALDIAERIRGLSRIGVARFFSGAALIAQGVQFGFVIRGSFYLRVDDESRIDFEARGAQPFTYAGRAKRVTVASYYEAPGEIIDDPDSLDAWAARALRAALAARRDAAPKRPRRTAGKSRR